MKCSGANLRTRSAAAPGERLAKRGVVRQAAHRVCDGGDISGVKQQSGIAHLLGEAGDVGAGDRTAAGHRLHDGNAPGLEFAGENQRRGHVIQAQKVFRADSAQQANSRGRFEIGNELGEIRFSLSAAGQQELGVGDTRRDEGANQSLMILMPPGGRGVDEESRGQIVFASQIGKLLRRGPGKKRGLEGIRRNEDFGLIDVKLSDQIVADIIACGDEGVCRAGPIPPPFSRLPISSTVKYSGKCRC